MYAWLLLVMVSLSNLPGLYTDVQKTPSGIIERTRVFTGEKWIGESPVKSGTPGRHTDTTVIWVDRNHQNAIAENVRIAGDGMHIFAGWWLNNERFSLYRTLGTGIPLWSFSTPTAEWMLPVGISEAGHTLAGGGSGLPLYEWSRESSIPRWSFSPPAGFSIPSYKSVGVSKDGSRIAFLAFEGDLGRLFVFDQDGNQLYTADFSVGNGIYGVDLSSDGSIIAVTTYNNVYIFENGTPRDTLSHYGQTTSRISGDGSIVVTGDFYGMVKVYQWDGANYNLLWSHHLGNPWVTAVSISEDGSTVMAGTGFSNGKVAMYEIGSSSPLWVYSNYGHYGAYISAVALSYDGKMGAASSWGDTASTGNFYVLTVHSRDNPNPIIGVTRDDEPGSLFDVDISSDGTYITAGGKAVHAYQWGNGGEVYALLVGSTPQHNVGCESIQSPPRFLQVGQTYFPKATFRNYGDFSETFYAHFEILDSLNSILYADSQLITLSVGETQMVNFSGAFTPTYYSYYYALAYTTLPADQYPGDDTITLDMKCFHDASAQSITTPFPEITVNMATTPSGVVHNNGSYSESFTVIFSIFSAGRALLYSDTVVTGPISPEHIDTIQFCSWTPSEIGLYIARIDARVNEDFNGSNDTLSKEFNVTYEIIYDDGTPEAYYWVGAHDNDKFAVRFTPTVFPPFYIVGARIYVNSTDAFDYVSLCPDNGSGLPDTSNPIQTVENVYAESAPGWASLEFNVLREDQNDLWLVVHWPNSATGPGIGQDATPPIDLRSYWYSNANGWNQWPLGDWMIRLMQFPEAQSVKEKDKSSPPLRLISLKPNPAFKEVNISFASGRKEKIVLSIYDVSGRLVWRKTYEDKAGKGVFVEKWRCRDLNGRKLGKGIYFLYLKQGSQRVREKLVVLR